MAWRSAAAPPGAAVAALRARLIAEARRGVEARATVFVPYADAALSAEIHRGCRVLDCRAEGGGMVLEIAGPAHWIARICQRAEVRA